MESDFPLATGAPRRLDAFATVEGNDLLITKMYKIPPFHFQRGKQNAQTSSIIASCSLSMGSYE